MRALRRIGTPVVVLLSGCTFPVDEFRAPSTKSDVGLSTNGDAAKYDDDSSAPDAKPDTCVCVKQTGSNCKEWSPADCGK